MDDTKLYALATKLNNLTTSYMNGTLKHMQYVHEYEKVLEANCITKKQLIAELEKRRNLQYANPQDQIINPKKR